jgi:competence protein ComEA
VLFRSMKYRLISIALTAAVLLGAGPALALDNKAAVASAPAASQTAASAKSKTPAKAPLVDINSAKRAELKTLPGISDAQAGKIIAGRPYGSKAQLVSRKVLDEAAYEDVRRLIIARQPYDDAAKNAALYTNKK